MESRFESHCRFPTPQTPFRHFPPLSPTTKTPLSDRIRPGHSPITSADLFATGTSPVKTSRIDRTMRNGPKKCFSKISREGIGANPAPFARGGWGVGAKTAIWPSKRNGAALPSSPEKPTFCAMPRIPAVNDRTLMDSTHRIHRRLSHQAHDLRVSPSCEG